MKAKILVILLILIGGFLTYYFVKNNESSGTYEIHVQLVDDKSPDRILKVLKNGKEFNNYKYIKYNDDKNIILCYQKNPAVNMFELNKEELVIVLNNDKEVIAKVIREDKS